MPLDPAHLGWVAVYGIVYTALVMSAAAWLFSKKEFT
jgi:ABC-type transport system involved in multi-copper enzyme maturation permease subunit